MTEFFTAPVIPDAPQPPPATRTYSPTTATAPLAPTSPLSTKFPNPDAPAPVPTSHADAHHHTQAGTTPLTADQQSAQAIINSTLAQWGLQTLGATAWQSYLQGLPIDSVMANIRNSTEYQQRFSGMKALQEKGEAISEADYIAKESADREMLRAYGVPEGLTSQQELGNLIGNQVSTAELQSRLNDYQQVVTQLPQEVRDYFQREQGVSAGDLLGYWLNPDVALPLIEQQTKAAAVGGAAAMSGFGTIDQKTALRLAGMQSTAFGDFRNTLNEFAKAAQLKGLTQALPGQQAQLTSDQLLNAEVGGNGDAQLAEQRASDAAKAQFNDGGDFMLGSKGAAGLGPNLS